MLDSLVLHDFRCFLRAEFRPGPGLNLLSAPNASGKSSLLEGICVALRLQSPRAGVLHPVLRRQGWVLVLYVVCWGARV